MALPSPVTRISVALRFVRRWEGAGVAGDTRVVLGAVAGIRSHSIQVRQAALCRGYPSFLLRGIGENTLGCKLGGRWYP